MDKIECTDKIQELLFNIPLFKDLPSNIKQTLLENSIASFFILAKKKS